VTDQDAATAPQEAAEGKQITSLGVEPLPTTFGAEAPYDGPVYEAPSFTLSEAAELTGRNRRTLRRWLDGGKFPNAFQADDEARTWRIPARDLAAAGLGTTPPDGERWHPASGTPQAPGQAPNDSRVADLERQLVDERSARKVLEAKLEGAQAIAAERAAQIEDLRTALDVISRNQLEAAPPPTPPGDTPQAPTNFPTSVTPAEPERRRWWKR
jgi:hypothetical protein